MYQNDASGPGRGSFIGASLLLVGVIAAVYATRLDHQFLHWDDNVNVWNNARLNPVTLRGVTEFWTDDYARLYAPLTYTFFALEALVSPRSGGLPNGALDPWVFHFGSLVLHSACALLVLAILARLFGSMPAALAGALLFAVHPVQVESVAWISETRGLLAAFFSLAAVALYVARWDAPAARASYATVLYVLATLSFMLALLSKPSAVVVPLIVLVLEIGLRRQKLGPAAAPLLLWFVLAAAFAGITMAVQGSAADFVDNPILARPFLALDAAVRHLFHIALPARLGPDYGYSPSSVMDEQLWFATGVLLIGLAYLLWTLPYKEVWLTALGVFFVALLPTLGLVTFDFQRVSTVADRYAYLALLGPAIALTWLLVRYGTPVRYGLVAVLLALLAVASFDQSKHWSDDGTLATHALKLNLRSRTFQNQAGAACFRNGEYDKARVHFEEAVELEPANMLSVYNLALTQLRLGEPEKAAANLREVVRQQPNHADAHAHLGEALTRLKDYAAARQAYQDALAANSFCQLAIQGLARLDTLELPEEDGG